MMVNQVALIRDKPKIPENSNASNRLDIVPAPISHGLKFSPAGIRYYQQY